MITVQLQLLDGFERAGFERLMRDIDAYRAEKQRKQAEEIRAAMESKYDSAKVVEDSEIAQEMMAQLEREPVDAEFVEQTVAPIAAEQTAAAPANKISDDDFQAAVRKYLKDNKLPATLALLQRHGVAKATDEMSPEVRAAIYAELTAA